jgi:hypothetical protein
MGDHMTVLVLFLAGLLLCTFFPHLPAAPIGSLVAGTLMSVHFLRRARRS